MYETNVCLYFRMIKKKMKRKKKVKRRMKVVKRKKKRRKKMKRRNDDVLLPDPTNTTRSLRFILVADFCKI